MATLIVCPRCKGSLPAGARACPRCGLVLAPRAPANQGTGTVQSPPLSGTSPVIPGRTSVPGYSPNGSSAGAVHSPEPVRAPAHEASPAPRVEESPRKPPRTYGTPGPAYTTRNTGPLAPRGALELLAGESVAYQLGALYLTTKRVILLSPSVVRSAFVRDIDAVGTFTDRASGWQLFFSALLLLLSGGGIYLAVSPEMKNGLPLLGQMPWPIMALLAALFALLGIFLLTRYFFWTKRTLFVSVKGRPLITVSIADWSQQKLEGMDEFVNAFFQIKDQLTGELTELP